MKPKNWEKKTRMHPDFLVGIFYFLGMFKKYLLFLFFIFGLNLNLYASKRIISLAPSITEEMYLLKAEDNLIANTIYCKIPKEAEYKEKIGSVVDVNLEKILVLNPDIVFTTELTNPNTIKKLKDFNIKVIEFFTPKNFKELSEQFLKLAKILEKEKEAEEIIRNLETEILEIKEKIKNLPKVKVFVEISSKPLMGIGRDSYINDLIELAGGVNIIETKTGLYSIEDIITKNPSVIIISDMGIDAKSEIKKWQRFEIDAVKNKKIYIFDSYKLCSPTPKNFIDTLEKFAEILHR